MSDAPIYKFTENNDWEGEVWDFFVRLTDDQHAAFKSLLDEIEDGEEIYSLSDDTFAAGAVKILVENAREGYMDSHNYAGALVKELPSVRDIEDEDLFYKGRFAEAYCDVKGVEL